MELIVAIPTGRKINDINVCRAAIQRANDLYSIKKEMLTTRLVNDLALAIKEKWELHNQLVGERICAKEQKRYLDAYQHLYVEAVLKTFERK